VIRHLEHVERLDIENIEPCAAINECLGDEYVAKDGREEHWECADVAAHLSWSVESKVMAYLDHLSGCVASSLGRDVFNSRANYLKMRFEAGAWEPPKMQAMARGSWKPPAPLSWWWSSFLLGGGGSRGRPVLP